jgi:hypothetical protein
VNIELAPVRDASGEHRLVHREDGADARIAQGVPARIVA